MLITIAALSLLVLVLLMSRVNYLKEHQQLKEKFKVTQDYADKAAKTNLELEATNRRLGSEIIRLTEAHTAAKAAQKSGTTPPTAKGSGKKTKVA